MRVSQPNKAALGQLAGRTWPRTAAPSADVDSRASSAAHDFGSRLDRLESCETIWVPSSHRISPAASDMMRSAAIRALVRLRRARR